MTAKGGQMSLLNDTIRSLNDCQPGRWFDPTPRTRQDILSSLLNKQIIIARSMSNNFETALLPSLPRFRWRFATVHSSTLLAYNILKLTRG